MGESVETPVPDYRDASVGGSMIRVACWLAKEVGAGGVFTKDQLRQTFPGVEQIDRRMRDLRKYGWVIDEYRVGPKLGMNELRLVEIGVPVWDQVARRAASPEAISDRVRQAVFHRDDHACVRCGIAAGEEYEDMPGTKARLTAAHVYPDQLGGKASTADLVTACQRCNESIRNETDVYLDGPQVLLRIQSLGRADRDRLLRRVQTNRRETDKVDDVWRAYLQLPAVERERLQLELKTLLSQ